ncbi:MAG: prephenate dehydratase [Limisphaerales bacterium]
MIRFAGKRFHPYSSCSHPVHPAILPPRLSPMARSDLILRLHFFMLPALNIPEHRKAIDKLDARLVRLLSERTRHVLAIGEIKRSGGQEIYAPHRERAVLDRIARLNPGPMTAQQLRAIYREIMSSALALEKTLAIAYLGPEATFTHQAAIRRFGSSLHYAAQKTIADVFTEVQKGRADYGVVPVENSTEGVVTHTLDMFVDSELKIVSQIILPIQYCLAGNGGGVKYIKRLHIHPQALGQCRRWVQQNLSGAEILEASSNARSAELASRDRKAGAVTGYLAAEKYCLQILEQDIQDNAANATRFLVLGRQCSPPTGLDRTSLMISVTDKVGALHEALASFRRAKINLTKIESRPSKRKAWEYFFFIDCDGHAQEKKVERTIRNLGEHCNFVKILGSYPNSD